MNQLLSNISWKKKIFGVTGLFILGLIVEALMGGFTILTQNNAMRQALEVSYAKVNAAITARVAILEMSRSQADLISQSDPQKIRDASIGAIRASSLLEESVQNLARTLGESPEIKELSSLIAEIKPEKMNVIRAARKNDDEQALQIDAAMQDSMSRVEELSSNLVDGSK